MFRRIITTAVLAATVAAAPAAAEAKQPLTRGMARYAVQRQFATAHPSVGVFVEPAYRIDRLTKRVALVDFTTLETVNGALVIENGQALVSPWEDTFQVKIISRERYAG